MTRFAQSLLQVQLQPNGGYLLELIGPERKESLRVLKLRLLTLQPFLDLAEQEFRQLGYAKARFVVQLHDEAPEPCCFRFDAPLHNQHGSKGPLIPDPYALGSNGFASLRSEWTNQPLPPWQERLPIAIWRGSTTGTAVLSPASISNNRRYQLCQTGRALRPWLDARFTNVVQSPQPHELEQKLREEDLLAPRLSPWHLGLHRWIVEIDGNVNSWGLLWKFLSGSCVLRVESERQQWYHHRMKPWEHVVPIASDLSDLKAVLKWCYAHPKACEAIATAGAALGRKVVERMIQDQQKAVATYASQCLAQP